MRVLGFYFRPYDCHTEEIIAPVTPLAARLFAAWSFTSATIRAAAAYNIMDRTSVFSFGYASSFLTKRPRNFGGLECTTS